MRPPRSSVVWLAAVAFAAGALAIVDAGGRRADGTFTPGSVYGETPEGLSLAFRYLSERVPVSVLSGRIGAGSLPADAVLFRVRPRRTPFPASIDEETQADGEPSPDAEPVPLLTPAEDAWVRGGGRLVLGLDTDYGPVGIGDGTGGGTVRKVFPLWPGVADLVPGEIVRDLPGAGSGPGHAVFVRGSKALLARAVFGEGDVLLLAVPELLENGRLSTADHLALLDALAGEGRPVAFDEWVHGLGQDEGLLALMFEWGLGPALLVGGLAFGFLLWRGRARLGPEEDDAVEERSEAVDLVESLAQLYDRALSRRESTLR